MKFSLITIYARKEPTQDSVAKAFADPKTLKSLFDVVFYKDKELRTPFARWIWCNNPPRKGTKTVTLNCWNWAVEWVN